MLAASDCLNGAVEMGGRAYDDEKAQRDVFTDLDAIDDVWSHFSVLNGKQL